MCSSAPTSNQKKKSPGARAMDADVIYGVGHGMKPGMTSINDDGTINWDFNQPDYYANFLAPNDPTANADITGAAHGKSQKGVYSNSSRLRYRNLFGDHSKSLLTSEPFISGRLNKPTLIGG